MSGPSILTFGRTRPPKADDCGSDSTRSYQEMVTVYELNMSEALNDVLEIFRAIVWDRSRLDAMIEFALRGIEFIDPLNTHEIAVLACARYKENSASNSEAGDVVFNYFDVLTITDRFRGKPMNTTMVYKTIENL